MLKPEDLREVMVFSYDGGIVVIEGFWEDYVINTLHTQDCELTEYDVFFDDRETFIGSHGYDLMTEVSYKAENMLLVADRLPRRNIAGECAIVDRLTKPIFTVPNKCSCGIVSLMGNGCKCGGK